MKRIFLTLIFISSLTLYSQSIDYLDQLNGYKDLKFGTNKSQLKSKIIDCTSSDYCLVTGDKYLNIKNVKIDNVYITFNNNKLFSVILILNGERNINELLNLYKETFGKASSRKKGELVLYWEAKKVVLSFEVEVDKNNNVSAVVIIAEKNSLSNQHKKEIQKNLNNF